MNSLKEHFKAILDACAKDAEIGCREEPRTNWCTYETDDVFLDISFTASGIYHEEGDGYNAPRETYITDVKVSVDDITGNRIVNEDCDEEDIPKAELDELAAYLEKELPELLED